jgi:hypothetical protein
MAMLEMTLLQPLERVEPPTTRTRRYADPPGTPTAGLLVNDTIPEAKREHAFDGSLVWTARPVATVQFPSNFFEKGEE